jgi:membrane associated rhomboid family serine protease
MVRWELRARTHAAEPTDGRGVVVMPIGVSAPPVRRWPVATAVLALLLVAVFVRTLLLRSAPPALFCSDLEESAAALQASADTVQGFVCRWGAIPDELRQGQDLVTLLTSVFVHTSWLHLLANTAFLVAFAPRVEEDLGRAGLLGVFLVSAAVAGAVHVLLAPFVTDPGIGASGGVAGVLGAHLLLAPRAEVRVLVGPVPVRLPTWFAIGTWAVLQGVYAVLVLRRAEDGSAVSYDVHVVGFAVGLLVVLVALRVRPDLRSWRPPAPPADLRAGEAR